MRAPVGDRLVRTELPRPPSTLRAAAGISAAITALSVALTAVQASDRAPSARERLAGRGPESGLERVHESGGQGSANLAGRSPDSLEVDSSNAPVAGAPPSATDKDDANLPRFEISVSYVANLVHWIDNLAGSSGGKTIGTYRRYWEARHGAPDAVYAERLRRWDALRAKTIDVPAAEVANASGCLPHAGEVPAWRQIFLVRSYEVPSIEGFVESLADHLDASERSDLRGILDAFEPRFAPIWKSMSHVQEFEKEFRRFLETSGLRPFLGEVARFLGAAPGAFPAGRIHLMTLPEDSQTFASAIGRDLMMEIRPGDGPAEQVQVIAHETSHYLWQMLPPERLEILATQVHSASPSGPVIWAMLREGLPTALGQGLADSRFVPSRFGLQFVWYHLPSIDRFAKEIYPALDAAFTKGETIDQGFLPRIASGGAGALTARAAPSDYLTEAVHVVGQGTLPAYGQVIRERPFRRRWLFPATDPDAAAFLDRYACLGGLILLGPAEAADPSRLAPALRPVAAMRGAGNGSSAAGPRSELRTDSTSGAGDAPVQMDTSSIPGSHNQGDQDVRPRSPGEENRAASKKDDDLPITGSAPPDGRAEAGEPLRSGVYATRRPGGGYLVHLVAAREADLPRVADLFLRLRRVPDAPVLLDRIEE